MKCLGCGTDSKKKERADGKCPKCHRKFVFDPAGGDKLTDTAFAHAIDGVSGGGKLKFTADNLYYEVCRRSIASIRKDKVFGCAVAAFVAFGIGIGIVLTVKPDARGCAIPFFVAAFIGLMVTAALLIRRAALVYVRIPRASFDEMLKRWSEVNGRPEGLIVRKASPRLDRPVEPDLHDYSFDRAVICDRPETVDLLLANRFHFENNCAVLGVSGYPEPVFVAVRAMLKRNPRLEVYALHDASPDGCRLAFRLSHDPQWFGGTPIRIVDVGLRPVHKGPFKGLYLKVSERVEADASISEEEAAWLRTHRLELAVIRPEQTLKRLYRAINGQQDDGGGSLGDGGGVTVDSTSFGSDADGSEGGADGFG